MDFTDAYNSPKLYDAESDIICEDIEFWKKVIENNTPQSLLEIGCGTGRIAKAIITEKINYTGIDLSENFLKYFRDTLSEHTKKHIKLIEGDARLYKFDEKFDLIILPINFISHIHNNQELEQLFKNLRSALSKNGRIIIDYFNPQIRFLDMSIKNQYCFSFYLDGEEIKAYETHNYNELHQINHIERKYISNTKAIKIIHLPMRIYFKNELEYIIKKSGLSISEVYGNYSFDVVYDYCDRLIYVLTLT